MGNDTAKSRLFPEGAFWPDVHLGTQVGLAGADSQLQVCLRADGHEGVKKCLSANHRAVGKHLGCDV